MTKLLPTPPSPYVNTCKISSDVSPDTRKISILTFQFRPNRLRYQRSHYSKNIMTTVLKNFRKNFLKILNT